MRSSSNFLWQLIQSLSSNEKQFFKRNFVARANRNDKIYVRLFDAIARQKEYNEEVILKKFHPAINKKNIAVQKNYLQKQVFDALIQYDSRNHPGHEIYNQVLLIRVLRNKGMLDDAHAIWKKAMARARSAESYALVNLLKTEFEKMILFSTLHTSNDELYNIFKGHIISYAGYAEMITLRDIYAEVVLLKRKAHFDLDDSLKERIKTLLHQIEQSDFDKYGRSFWFCHYYHMSRATLLYMQNDIAGSLALLKRTLNDWKKNASFVSTDGEYYIELLYMINYAGILHGSYKFVMDAFSDPLNDLITDPAQRAGFEVIKYLAMNKIYNKTARYDEVEKLVQFMKLKYRKWEPLINADLNSTVNISLGISCFVLEQYEDALYFTRRGITYFKSGTRDEHRAVAQILLLLISYKLGNPRLFDAQQKSTYTYFYKRKKKHPFETALVQCLSRTFYMKEKKNILTAFRETLALLEAGRNDPVQQQAFSIFNYPAWLISQVQKTSYREYVTRQVREKTLNESKPTS